MAEYRPDLMQAPLRAQVRPDQTLVRPVLQEPRPFDTALHEFMSLLRGPQPSESWHAQEASRPYASILPRQMSSRESYETAFREALPNSRHLANTLFGGPEEHSMGAIDFTPLAPGLSIADAAERGDYALAAAETGINTLLGAAPGIGLGIKKLLPGAITRPVEAYQTRRATAAAERKSQRESADAIHANDMKRQQIEQEIAALHSADNPNAVFNANHPRGWEIKDQTTGKFLSADEVKELAQNNLDTRAWEMRKQGLLNALNTPQRQDAADALQMGRELRNMSAEEIAAARQARIRRLDNLYIGLFGEANPSLRPVYPPLPLSPIEEAEKRIAPKLDALYRPFNRPAAPSPRTQYPSFGERHPYIKNALIGAASIPPSYALASFLERQLRSRDPEPAPNTLLSGGGR